MNSGWMQLVGMTRRQAKAFVLRTFFDRLEFWVSNKAQGRDHPVYVVIDDGFDDAAGYRPHLFLFLKKDVVVGKKAPKDDYRSNVTFTDDPIARRALSPDEQAMVSGFCSATWGSDGPGVGFAGVVAEATITSHLKKTKLFPAGWWSNRVVRRKWLVGRKWDAERFIEKVGSVDNIRVKQVEL